MICYKDMTFCSRDCANTDCKLNKKNINKPKELDWMPVAYRDFKDCKVMMNDYNNKNSGHIQVAKRKSTDGTV